jgi:plastocyanin
MAKLRIVLFVLALALGVGACGSGNGSGSASNTTKAPAGGATGTTVTLKDLKFNPDQLAVHTGDTVTWKWGESVLHNITAKDSSFKSDNKSDGTFTHTFDKAGTYNYECTLHSGMTGEIDVS